ncbi:P-loop containing nucleoside triphosphate hydrolase protein [Pisolithus microcarpus]|nr:P-loop containing nucleoside triphosphate hydrolase protein [Pisolithus microcarpus]
MSCSPALSDLPVEDDWDPRVDQAMGHSELGIAVSSGALSMQVASDASFASDPENPSTDSISNPHSPVQLTLSSNAVLPKGTPSAIGALRLCKSAVFQSYSTPFQNRNLNLVSPQINSTPTKAVDEEGSDTELEREEANFVLEAARAQRNMCILEQQLAAAKVDEMIALGNLYRFRAQTAEHKLEDANIDYAAEYWDTSPGKSHLHPHVFQLASNAYYHMRHIAQDQSILFSGETTRGKSENRRLAIKTFLEFSILNPRKKGAKLSLPQSPSPERSTGARPNAVRANDAHRFEQLKVALKTISLSKRHAVQACQVITAILHLGNLEFTIDCSRDVDTAVMHNIDTLALVAESLGIQPSALKNALSYKTKLVKKELCTVFLDSDGASDNRNNLAKTLYSLLFTWLNEHINQHLCRDDFDTFISLFDLPSPQNMTGRSNLLDQFCINFANERLHHFIQQCLFESHIDEYQSEGNHSSFKLGGGLDRSGFPTFTICLFNGLVTYSSEVFLEHNLDALNSDFTALLHGMAVGTGVADGGEGAGSINPFVQVAAQQPVKPMQVPSTGWKNTIRCMPHDNTATGTAPTITEEEHEDEDVAVPQNTGTPCVVGEFCTTLDTLFDTLGLGDTQNWFIFCINPNDSQLPNQLEEQSVKGQVRSAGLVEVAKRGGSNVQGGRDGTPAEQIERMRVALGLGETDVVLGQHKVFLSQAAFHAMEDYLCAADVEEQKCNQMHEAEVEAIGVNESTYANTYSDQAPPLVRARPSIENTMKSDRDDSNSNYGTESYPPSNMFQHVDKEGLMAKDPLPRETMEGETTEIVKEMSARR